MPNIKIGNQKGPHFTDFQQENLARLVEMAEELKGMPGAEGVMVVWYDPVHDFCNLMFTMSGVKFLIQKYKRWSVTKHPRKSDKGGGSVMGFAGLRRGYGRYCTMSVLSLFRTGEHLAKGLWWEDMLGIQPKVRGLTETPMRP